MNDARRIDVDIRAARVALLFIDGFGWGIDDPSVNPNTTYGGWRLLTAGQPHQIDARD